MSPLVASVINDQSHVLNYLEKNLQKSLGKVIQSIKIK